jgi:hypothetical protein
LRWVTRAGVRSCGAALIRAVASASINAWNTDSTARRTTSSASATFNASNNSNRAD